MKKLKVLIFASLLLSMFLASKVNANEEDNHLVCYYQKNSAGELEYICVESDETNHCQDICPPPCWAPDY